MALEELTVQYDKLLDVAAYRDIDLIWTVDSNRDVSWTHSVSRYTTYVKTHHPACFLPGMTKIQGEI